MKPRHYLDEHFLRAIRFRDQVENMGESMTDRRFKESMIQDLKQKLKIHDTHDVSGFFF